MKQYDRLCIVMNHPESVSLIGYAPAHKDGTADLENGFPCDGRWKMDYVDSFPAGTDPEHPQDVADSLWGTVYTDSGEVYEANILKWSEYKADDDHILWARRDKTLYEQKCVEAFTQESFTKTSKK